MFTKKIGFTRFAFTFAAGALAGAAVALLYAPMPGRRIQKKVGTVTGKVLDVVEEKVEDAQGFIRKVAKA